MADIILFFPKHWIREFKSPTQAPFGLMMISDYILKKGYSVKIFDERIQGNNLNSLIKDIKKAKIFGISAQSGPQINNGLKASNFAKQVNKDIKIVWGGVHATLLPEQTLKNPLVDIVVIGEGEETFKELTHAMIKNKSLKKIKGIGYKEKGKMILNQKRELIKNIDEINIRWELVNPKDYIHRFEGRKSLSTITSRGCYFRCAFCYNQTFFGARWFRGWSTKKVMDEIKKLNDWGIETIKFEDDNMLVDKKRAEEICKQILKQKYDFLWSAPLRANYFTDNFAKILKKAGFQYTNIGAESGSQRILDLMHKDAKPEYFLKAAKIGRKYSLDLSYHWILGYPTETTKEVFDTVNLIKKIEKTYPKSYHILNIFAPYPGTEAYQLAIKKGFRPQKKLENWTNNFREECKNLKYIKNKHLLETIRLSGILKTLNKRTHWYKPIYRPIIKITGKIQNLRWKSNMFSFAPEISLIKLLKNKLME